MDKSLEELYLELPGCAGLPPPPRELFEKMRRRRGGEYRPRTRHLRPDGLARYTNRLFLETSPYLLQHAHNPVNWFPWGNEAFNLARELRRPVLVSIGYATCHWCHVMEEESFENEQIAEFLNRHFIAVKVDREERPDVDSVYMNAVHAMGMQGGWPLNVFVTPERQPFYGGTYFPPFDHSRGVGFLSLLSQLSTVCQSEPERVLRAGLQLTEAVRSMLTPRRGGGQADPAALDLAVQAYVERFDKMNGGLLGAPKFPSSLPVRLVLRQYLRTGDELLLNMARLTLKKMAAGGIYDQIGGGFHRYAVDDHWLVPHFEKMLYDNALLAVSYLEGYQATQDPELASVAREILRYLKREMTSPDGGLYSATDADSLTPKGEKEEGFFFTWTPEEVEELLGKERGEVVEAFYGITRSGNFEGRSIPHRDKSLAEVARELNRPEAEVAEIVEQSREILYRARSRRPLPLRDEKILASWNGLAISAFARGGLVLGDGDLLEQAEQTARFVLERMMPEGRLAHSHQEGEARGEGFLDDYAFFIAALIDLFEATGDAGWLESSLRLSAVVEEEFTDRDTGGYFLTGVRHEQLIAREKPAYDGVVPSGNSVMFLNLLRLNALSGEQKYLELAQRGMRAFASFLDAAPTALSEMLAAVHFLNDTSRQVAIVAPRGQRGAARELLRRFGATFLPNRSFVFICEGEELERAGAAVPFLKGKRAEGERALAYLCENQSCGLPTGDPEEFGRRLAQSARRR